MNTYEIQSVPEAKMISLYRLLDEMLTCYGRVRKDHRKFFINEVPRNLSVSLHKDALAPILGDLFAIISANPGNNCVRISAAKSKDDITLFVKNTEIRGFSFSGIRVHAA